MKFTTSLSLAAAMLLPAGLVSCSLIGPLINTALPFAGVKLAFACVPESVSVDTPDGPRAIGKIQAGDTVTGFGGQPVRVLQKHGYLEDPNTEFFHIHFTDGAEVEVCGMHRVEGVRAKHITPGRLLAGRTVARIEITKGETRSCDLLTEDAGYQIQGVPVNSMIGEMQKAAATGMRSVKER